LGWNPETGRFMHNEDLTLSYDAIIVDEASMIDAQLLESLLRAVGPDTAVVFIGDDNQLPPVGPGYPLRDILEYTLIPYHRLMKCHRQAGTLKHNCVKIIEDGIVEPSCLSEGDPGPWLVHRQLETPERVLAAVEKLFNGLLATWENPFGLSFGPIMNHQFMTARHDGPLGTKKLNELLQRLAQSRLGVALPERPADETLPLLVGDKVIQTKNNYTINVMNGTIGTVVNDLPLTVDYDGREVQYSAEQKYDVSLAYCLSVHKMQGSEVPCVVVICPNAHAFMQHRSWLYTACTRAQFTCVVLGDNNGIRRAGDGKSKERRRTVLELYAKCPEVRPSHE